MGREALTGLLDSTSQHPAGSANPVTTQLHCILRNCDTKHCPAYSVGQHAADSAHCDAPHLFCAGQNRDTDATASRERSTSRHPGREPSLTSTFRSPPRQLSVRSLADETVTVVEETVTATVQVAGIHARNSGVTLARRPAARPCDSARTRRRSLLRCEGIRTGTTEAHGRNTRGRASWSV